MLIDYGFLNIKVIYSFNKWFIKYITEKSIVWINDSEKSNKFSLGGLL